MNLRAKRRDRTGRPVVCRLWTKPQTCDFQDFSNFVVVRSFTADGGLLQPTEGCKENTSQVHVRSANLSKELIPCAGQKVNKFGALTTSEFGTQSDKPNTILNDLKHVETHEYINQ